MGSTLAKNKIQILKPFDNEQEAIKFKNKKRVLNKLKKRKKKQRKPKQKNKKSRRFIKNWGKIMNVKVKLLRQLVKLLEKIGNFSNSEGQRFCASEKR
ncbi:MAG: hypothetical protein Ct9H90mP28_5800 [Paracoccaceae bacterium]|nr:MAG: hypothetical protein Ct9H90mP28_5800 [Paracoccaceae bacterium]